MLGTITIMQLIHGMSIEEKVGQLFLVGFNGKTYNASIDSLLSRNVGGFIIYSRNVDDASQVKRLIEEINRHNPSRAKIPLIFGIDQEGEFIARIRKGVFVPPNEMAIGAAGDPKLSYDTAYLTGKSLHDIGINMNFSPVLDVNSNPRNPIIGVRAFWSNPDTVIKMGMPYIKGLLDGGVLPVAKHFPGHGAAYTDSHIGLPRIKRNIEELKKVDLAPFEMAVKEGIPAIMTAHIVVDAIDPKYPATLSGKAMDMLRKDMGFSGTIISDDMLMGAISKNYSTPKAIKMALLAGVDMFIIWKNHEDIINKSIDYIVSEVKNGNIPEEVLDRAVKNVLTLKLKMERLEPKVQKIDPIKTKENIAKRAIYKKGDWTFKKGGKYLIFVPSRINTTLVQEGYKFKDLFTKEVQREGIETEEIFYNIKDSPYKYIKEINKYRKNGNIIFLLPDTMLNPHVIKFADLIIRKSPNSLIISTSSPYDYLWMKKKPKNYIVTYSFDDVFIKVLLKFLNRTLDSVGKLPYNLR